MIVNCTIMRLRENEALHYLKSNGHEISRITYYRVKRRVEQQKLARIVGPEGSFRFEIQSANKIWIQEDLALSYSNALNDGC
jgi:hypothetical protein